MASRDTPLPPTEKFLDPLAPPPSEAVTERPEYPLGVDPNEVVPRKPHPGFWWSVLWCIVFLFVTQIIPAILMGLVLVVIAVVSPKVFGESLNVKGMMGSPVYQFVLGITFFVVDIFTITFSLLVIRLVVGRAWPRVLALRRPGGIHFLLVLAGFPAFVVLGNGAYFWLRYMMHVPSLSDLGIPGMEEMVQVFNGWPAGFAVLVIGLGPGIGEELWCRGFLGRGLVGRYGWLGVVLTSFFFGLIHLDPCQGTMALLMGLWLHFMYLTTRSLWMPMMVHFLNNSLSVVSSRVPVLREIEKASLPLYLFVGAAALLLAVGLALYGSRCRLAADDGRRPPDWQPAYPGVEYPPPESHTRVTHPLPSPAAFLAVLLGALAFTAASYLAFP
jgi:membrane protease YdiL (CAAX protease family)